MGFLVFILFLAFPFLSLPFSVFGLLTEKKGKWLYCFFLAFVLGLVAYFYVPDVREDLFYHLHTIDYIRLSLSSDKLITFDLTEPLTLLIKYLVAFLNNPNLLQFFVGTLSYFIILYLTTSMIQDRKIFIKIVIYLFVISTFNFLTVISNLFCNLGLLIFSYGIYREYFKKKKGVINVIIYLISFLIHNSLIFPIAILVIYKMSKQKKLKNIIVTMSIFLLAIPIIVQILSNFSFISIINTICEFYNEYFVNNSDFDEMHTFNTILLYLLKMIPFIMSYFIAFNKREDSDDLVFIYFYSIILLLFMTTFAIRFIPIVVLLGIPMICKIFSQSTYKTISFIITVVMILLSILFFYYQFIKTDLDKIKINIDNITDNIISIWH